MFGPLLEWSNQGDNATEIDRELAENGRSEVWVTRGMETIEYLVKRTGGVLYKAVRSKVCLLKGMGREGDFAEDVRKQVWESNGKGMGDDVVRSRLVVFRKLVRIFIEYRCK